MVQTQATTAKLKRRIQRTSHPAALSSGFDFYSCCLEVQFYEIEINYHSPTMNTCLPTSVRRYYRKMGVYSYFFFCFLKLHQK